MTIHLMSCARRIDAVNARLNDGDEIRGSLFSLPNQHIIRRYGCCRVSCMCERGHAIYFVNDLLKNTPRSSGAKMASNFFAHDMSPIDNKTTISSYSPQPANSSYHNYAAGEFQKSKSGAWAR